MKEESLPAAGDDALSRRSLLMGVAGAAVAASATDAVAAPRQKELSGAPAVLSGSMAGRKYRGFVRFETRGEIEELRLLPLADDRVVVRVEASQCTYTECDLVLGSEREPQATIPGFGGVGVVEAVGSSVKRVQVGDRVFVADAPYCGQCYACLHGRPDRCFQSIGMGMVTPQPVAQLGNGTLVFGAIDTGGYAELLVARECFCVPFFENQSPATELAMLHETCCVGLGAAFGPIAPIEPGSDVVVFGCGPVGIGAVQGARIKGASRIVAVEPIRYRRDIAMKVGATVVLDPNDYFDKSRPDYDFRSQMERDPLVVRLRELCRGPSPTDRRLAGGRPYNVNANLVGPDFVIEAVGGDRTSTRPAGTDVGPDPSGVLPLYQAWAACSATGHVTTLSIFHQKDFTLRADQFSLSSKSHAQGTHFGENALRDLPMMARLVQTGQFDARSLVTAVHPLEGIKEAYRKVADRTTMAAVIVF